LEGSYIAKSSSSLVQEPRIKRNLPSLLFPSSLLSSTLNSPFLTSSPYTFTTPLSLLSFSGSYNFSQQLFCWKQTTLTNDPLGRLNL